MTGAAPASAYGKLVLAAAIREGTFVAARVAATAMSVPAASLWRYVVAAVWLPNRPGRAGAARVPSPAR